MDMRQSAFISAVLLLGGCDAAHDATAALRETYCASPQSDPSRAVVACTQLIEDSRTSPHAVTVAQFNRATARQYGGDLPGAIADVQQVIARDPDHPDAPRTLGALLGMSGDIPAAKKAFESVLARNPDDIDALNNLGTAFEHLGEREASLQHFDRSLALDPSSWPAAAGRCWVLAVLNRELDKALADCDRALAVNPTDYNSYNSRGFVNFRLGRYSAPIANYDSAIGGDPGSGSSWYMRGMARRALGHVAQGDADIAKGRSLRAGIDERYASFGVEAPPPDAGASSR